MDIKVIGIAGSGTMGSSMAWYFAKRGYSVKLYDPFPEALERAKHLINLSQEDEVKDGLLPESEVAVNLARITCGGDMNMFSDVDFLVEAIPERLDLKHEFWSKASRLTPAHAVLASNTSGLSITSLAESVVRPEQLCGMHWINPSHLIPLVEVIWGEKTSRETARAVFDLAVNIGKKPVMVKDCPGFVLNRIQLAIIREALHIVEQGVASTEDVDRVMKYGLGRRYACLGPFEVADLGGLDIFYQIASYLFADLSDVKEPFGLLKELREKGELGVKTGKGFFDYSGGKADEAIRNRDELFTRVAKCLTE